jgi:hypothetical protein
VTLLANMALVGLPVDRYLDGDRAERALLQAVTERAVSIVNRLAEGR